MITLTASQMAKLGSIIVHSEELTEVGAHAFDVAALRALIRDPEVQEFRKQVDGLGLLPVKRGE